MFRGRMSRSDVGLRRNLAGAWLRVWFWVTMGRRCPPMDVNIEPVRVFFAGYDISIDEDGRFGRWNWFRGLGQPSAGRSLAAASAALTAAGKLTGETSLRGGGPPNDRGFSIVRGVRFFGRKSSGRASAAGDVASPKRDATAADRRAPSPRTQTPRHHCFQSMIHILHSHHISNPNVVLALLLRTHKCRQRTEQTKNGTSNQNKPHNKLTTINLLFFRVFVFWHPIPQAPIWCCFVRFAALGDAAVGLAWPQQNEKNEITAERGQRGCRKRKHEKKWGWRMCCGFLVCAFWLRAGLCM